MQHFDKDIWTDLLKLTEFNVSSMMQFVLNIPGWSIPKNSGGLKFYFIVFGYFIHYYTNVANIIFTKRIMLHERMEKN